VHLAENPVFQDSLAAQGRQTGNKECQGSQRDHCDDHHKGNGRLLKGHRVHTKMKDLMPPRCSDDGGRGESNRRKGYRHLAEETEAPVFVGVSGHKL
jgi:hypothetical protein